MAFRVGDILEETFSLTNLNDNLAILGSTFTTEFAFDPSGGTIAIVITELEDGAYKVATNGPALLSGEYRVQIRPVQAYPNNAPFLITWDVDTGWDTTTPITTSVGQTRKTIRRRVMAKFGDLLILRATATGTTTTLIDTVHLVGEPNRYTARYVNVTGGTAGNLGQLRYVDGSSRDTSSIHFASALPVATASGDEMEMTNTYGVGITFDSVHDAINYAIDVAQPLALVPINASIATPFDGESARTIAIPANFVAINRVQYQNPDTFEWKNVRNATSNAETGWSIDVPNREVLVNGNWSGLLNERTVRISGYAVPAPLTVDTDMTSIDLEWLVLKACAHLCLDVVAPRQASNDWVQRGMLYEQQAEARQTRLTPNLGPSFKRL